MRDVKGIERGHCLECGIEECEEFLQGLDGNFSCDYCDHVPTKHVKYSENKQNMDGSAIHKNKDVPYMSFLHKGIPPVQPLMHSYSKFSPLNAYTTSFYEAQPPFQISSPSNSNDEKFEHVKTNCTGFGPANDHPKRCNRKKSVFPLSKTELAGAQDSQTVIFSDSESDNPTDEKFQHIKTNCIGSRRGNGHLKRFNRKKSVSPSSKIELAGAQASQTVIFSDSESELEFAGAKAGQTIKFNEYAGSSKYGNSNDKKFKHVKTNCGEFRRGNGHPKRCNRKKSVLPSSKTELAEAQASQTVIISDSESDNPRDEKFQHIKTNCTGSRREKGHLKRCNRKKSVLPSSKLELAGAQASQTVIFSDSESELEFAGPKAGQTIKFNEYAGSSKYDFHQKILQPSTSFDQDNVKKLVGVKFLERLVKERDLSCASIRNKDTRLRLLKIADRCDTHCRIRELFIAEHKKLPPMILQYYPVDSTAEEHISASRSKAKTIRDVVKLYEEKYGAEECCISSI